MINIIAIRTNRTLMPKGNINSLSIAKMLFFIKKKIIDINIVYNENIVPYNIFNYQIYF